MILKSGSQLQKKKEKKKRYLLDWKPFKNAFYFNLNALFVLTFLSRLFGHVGKTAWLER